MKRRAFLELLASGVVGFNLDIDKLLWVPGQKTIFLPTPIMKELINYQDIINEEMNRIMGILPHLFEVDNTFYQMMKRMDE